MKKIKDFGQISVLATQTAKGIFWSISGKTSVSVIRLVGTLFLARILVPEDFGIVGIALLFSQILTLFGQIGFSSALIQKKEITETDKSTIFWLNFGISLILMGFAWLGAPLAAIFFEMPELTASIRVLSYLFLFGALATIHVVILRRELKFRSIALIEFTSTLFRFILVVALALRGYGFWSIIFANLADRAIKTILFILKVHWLPLFVFDVACVKECFKFSKNLYFQVIIQYLNNNLDFFLIGKMLGAKMLGYYQFSFNLPHLVLTLISESVYQVIFPVYSKIQDDIESLRKGYLKSVKYIAYVAFPLMTGLFFLAEEFIGTFYGEQWGASILPMKILCLSGAIRSITYINKSLFYGVGKPEIALKWDLFLFPITLGTIYFASNWGLVGVAIGMVLVSIIYIFSNQFVFNIIHSNWSQYLKNLYPSVVLSLLVFVSLEFFNGLFDFKTVVFIDQFFDSPGKDFKVFIMIQHLIFNFLIGAITYIAAFLFFFKNDFLNVVKILKRKKIA